LASIPPGEKFTDTDFPTSKWEAGEYAGHASRLSDKFQPKLQINGFNPADINQGALGDCWFLSAIACCAGKPGVIENLFQHQDEEKGIYVIRLFQYGVFRDIAVDDYVPMMSWGVPAYASSSAGDKEAWVSMLEKAYAKMYGSFNNLSGGHVNVGCVDMTGGTGDMLNLEEQAEAINDGSLWARLKGLMVDGHLLGAGSHSGDDTPESAEKNRGIVSGHAYSVLRVEEIDGLRLMQCRNPWGRTEWTGDFSDGSTNGRSV